MKEAYNDLVEAIRLSRIKCPWAKEVKMGIIIEETIKEAQEMKEAFDKNNIENLKEELIIKLRKDIVVEEQEYFRKIMENSGIKNVKMPISYTQLGGRITEADKKALEKSGIRFYFDVYYNDEIGPISSTDYFDVVQYGVGFTKDGNARPESVFRTSEEIIKQLNRYNRSDVEILKINGIPVIPLWVHQQDFESSIEENKLDTIKWRIYTETLLRLKKDPNIKFITPSEMYKLRHNSEILYLN